MSTKVQSRYARMKQPIPPSPIRVDTRKHCEMSSQYENLYNNTGTNPREDVRPEKKDSSNSSGKAERKRSENKEFRGRFSNSWPQAHKSASKQSLSSKLSCRSADRSRGIAEPESQITRFISSDDIVITKKEPSSHEIIRYARKKTKRPATEYLRKGKARMIWNDYRRLKDIHAFMDELEVDYPSICTGGIIGQSLECRPLKIIKISNSDARNAAVWLDAGIHAREWIAPAVATYLIDKIVKNFHTMPKSMTNKDWYILPVMNPDGYEHSHTKERMWRKNRAWHGGRCVGVDLNRNFSFGWGEKGSSDVPTDAFYRGPEPFSEPESSAVRDILSKSGIQFKVYITLHCYGQIIMFPFSYKPQLCPDYVRLLEGAMVMSKAIYETNGNTYKVGLSRDVMYGAAGTSNDWSYGEAKIPFCYLIELRTINIWKEENSTMDIMVDGQRAAYVAGMLHERDIPFSIAVGDVGLLMEKELNIPTGTNALRRGPGSSQSRQRSRVMDWKNYHRLETIYNFMDSLTSEFPFLCNVIVIGKTFEGRDIKLLKISNEIPGNEGIWLDGSIHAREWISPAVATYIADHIVRNFEALPEYVTNKDWYILPVFNPDGYEYTHTHDRMWRKNRATFGECVGVDLNRNFSHGWGEKGEEGSSEDPGNIFYRGPKPFSESETKAVRKAILESDTKFKVFLSLHSYGEVIIFPWGYTSDPCPDYVPLLQGGCAMAKAIHETTGQTYKVGSTKDLMYYASGTSVDWSYGEAKIRFSYMLELRDKKHRFLLPKDQIIATCNEVMQGIFKLLEFINKENPPEGTARQSK